MPYKEKELKKVYWKIGEAAKFISTKDNKIAASTIRFWCNEFSNWLKPKRDRVGKRLFNQSELETLIVIRNLLYYERFTTAGAKRRLTLLSSTVWN